MRVQPTYRYIAGASGAFRRFVVAAATPAERTRWHRFAGSEGWHLWRNVILVLMTLGVGFVFVTQRDVFVGLGAFLAVLGGLPLAARLFSGFGTADSRESAEH